MSEEQTDLVFEPVGRYLSLHGRYIDYIGEQPHHLVTTDERRNREIRDHGGHHITVINHLDIMKLHPTKDEDRNLSSKAIKKLHRKNMYKVYSMVSAHFGPAANWAFPLDMGMGSTSEGGAVTYFRVLFWPFGQRIRRQLGVGPTHFHITVGFSPHDVHLYKGPATLLCLRSDQYCTPQHMDRLVTYAGHFINDWEYITKLYKTCWRHGYYYESIRLTRLVSMSLFWSLYYKLFKKDQRYPATPVINERIPLIIEQQVNK